MLAWPPIQSIWRPSFYSLLDARAVTVHREWNRLIPKIDRLLSRDIPGETKCRFLYRQVPCVDSGFDGLSRSTLEVKVYRSRLFIYLFFVCIVTSDLVISAGAIQFGI